MCFLLFCFTAEGYKICWKLKPSPRLQQTVSKRHRLPNDRCSTVVTEVVVWTTWKSRHHHLLASHCHKILLGLPSAFIKCTPPPPINILMEVQDGVVTCETLPVGEFSEGINHSCSSLCMCCFCFETPCSASLPVIYPMYLQWFSAFIVSRHIFMHYSYFFSLTK